jgi:RNA polymerase sigma factor (sigma-70 family)|tara:strand:+ start:76 stop:828 length:753 start_codon:yes stop_codon:yes gene_type:complete
MKKYNQSNFSRYKRDVKSSQPEGKFWDEYTRDELIVKFMPLVENISRKFKDSDAANGVVSLSDRIQFGHIGLIKAVDKIDWPTILNSTNAERTLKSYLAKRIRGAIRRATDANRSGMRIPEHKLNEIRGDFDNPANSELYFNSIFQSIDASVNEEDDMLIQIPDNSSDPMLKEKLSSKIRNIMLKNLSDKEYHVVRLSYGLGCNKMSAKEIAEFLDMKGTSSYVRVSQLKKQAIIKLRNVLDRSQVIDYL